MVSAKSSGYNVPIQANFSESINWQSIYDTVPTKTPGFSESLAHNNGGKLDDM